MSFNVANKKTSKMSKRVDKKGSALLNSTSPQMDMASNDVRINKSMKRNNYARQAVIPNSTNGEQSDGVESSNMSSMAPSHQVDSQMRPNFSVQSINLRDSKLIDVPPLLALNSTELSTMAMISNVANDLRNIGLVQSPMVSPKENKVHQNRPMPTNGKRHHGKSINVSMVLPTRTSNQHQQRSMNSYLLAPYDGELNTIPPMLALNSTAQSVVVQSETIRDNKLVTDTSRSFEVISIQQSTNLKNDKPSNNLQKNASVKTSLVPKQNTDADIIPSPVRPAKRGENKPNNVSVPLLTQSRSQVPRYPSASKDPIIPYWMDELKRFWCQIEDQIKSSLQLIKKDRIQRCLLFDDKFKRHFLQSTYAKIVIAFEQFLVDERCYDEFFDTTFVNTDTDQRGQPSRANINNDNVHDNESRNASTYRRIQSSTTAVRHLPNANQNQFSSNSSNQKDSIDQSIVCEDQSVNSLSAFQSSELNSYVSHCNHDDQTSISSNRIESSLNTQQRVEINQNTGQRLPNITEELDIFQRSITISPDNVNDVIVADNDIELTLTNDDDDDDAVVLNDEQEIQPVMLSDTNIGANPLGLTSDRIGVRVCSDHEQDQGDGGDEPTTSNEISNKQSFETIDPFSDQEGDVNCDGNGYVENVSGQSQPTVQQRKTKNLNTTIAGNSKKKRKLTDTMDTAKHMRTHSNDQPYQCECCGVRFTRQCNLATHLKKHGEFQCLKCRRGFEHENIWKLHESCCKSKQYECYLCNRKFYQRKSDLFRHMRSWHTGEKPFGCCECSKQFNDKSALKIHMKNHHDKGN